MVVSLSDSQLPCCPQLSCVSVHWGVTNIILTALLLTALEPSVGPPGSASGPADTHQKFMAALAKAALAQVATCACLHTVCQVVHFALGSK